LIYVFSQDFTVFGGSLSETHAEKICRIMDLAMQNGAPLIGLNDSGGARIQEGVVSLGGYADIFYKNTMASGVIPQLSAIMGPCAGGAVYSPAITDFIMMVENTSYMFVTGPNVVKTVTHEEVTSEELGGASAHSMKSGVTHFSCANEIECINNIKALLSYMPQNCEDDAPSVPYESNGNEKRPALNTIIPDNANQPYDIREVIEGVIDDGTFLEVHKNYAENIVVGFARLAGRSIGIVANNPKYSYVRSKDGLVTDIVEKSPISPFASSGLYGFQSSHLYQKMYEGLSNTFIGGEMYIANLLTYMIDKDCSIGLNELNNKYETIVLGTPQEYGLELAKQRLQ
jgi:propionyl-CoA carboxylase beta chain